MILRTLPLANPLCIRLLTHYEVLGIPRTATKADIKKAYLDKAKECHPDLNPDNEKAAIQFQQIQEAHDVLLSSKQRAQYNHQINQERYYGGQQNQHNDGGTRRSSTKSYGVNYPYTNRPMNEEYHEKHRVNRDNYQHPGSQRKHYASPQNDDLDSAMWNHSHTVYLIGLVGSGVFIYVFIRMFLSVNEEIMEGRHTKHKSLAYYFADAKRKATSWNGLYSDLSVSDRPSKPVEDTHKVVWDEDQQKLVRKSTLDLQSKFDTTMQSNLGKVKEVPVPLPQTKPITPSEVSLLKVEMSKKKSEYLAAKKEYLEKLKLYNEEQDDRKSKISERLG